MDVMRSSVASIPRPEALIDKPAVREVIPHDPRYSARWHQHDYPSPIARWNFHPEYEIHLVTQGTGRFIVGDQVGNFTAGQLVMVGPELPHHWISDLAPGEHILGRDIVLQFLDDWIQACIQLMPELGELRSMLSHSTRGIEFLGDTATRAAALLAKIGAATGTDRLLATIGVLGVLAHAPDSERRFIANEWIPSIDDPASAEVVNRTLEYIFTNMNRDVRLSEAAGMIGMSESAFSRYFKRASGHTFSDIVRRLRIAHACKLLDSTADPISTIAHDVGYQNLSNFNRQFLAETAQTPTAYRKRESRLASDPLEHSGQT
ncbi:transcriptional regulator, AraC family [Microbacterium hydrothermale]|uniref:AraC family transcriptional regulator n=1 Tax=Microbacterium hydrothermale TaxID=857427 RepID=UPI0022261BD4|nr:AraC family transcriptional regulator [Microbacterium hydrothermale]MCW2162893.1 transcriptional regulator, AraC family [Microbacterium hydrothermale]